MLILKKANIRLAVLLVLFLSTEFGLGPQPAEAEEGAASASDAPASGGGGGGAMECHMCDGKDCLTKFDTTDKECNGKCASIFKKKGTKYLMVQRGCLDKILPNAECDLVKDNKDCMTEDIGKLGACMAPGGGVAPAEPGDPSGGGGEPQSTQMPSKRDADEEMPDKVEVCVCDGAKCNSMVKGGVSRISENQAVILWAVASVIALAPAVLSAPFAVSFPQKI